MFVIENYMHIEHRHTKCMGCLKQHNTGWSSTWRERESEGERQTERVRDRQTERQRHRQTETDR